MYLVMVDISEGPPEVLAIGAIAISKWGIYKNN
jgi:hypothetical protein